MFNFFLILIFFSLFIGLKIFKSTPQGITATSSSLNPSLIKPTFDQLEEVITLIDLFMY